MAFIGILFVGALLWVVLVFIAILILFVFIPCLIIAIINLVKGIQNHWPKRNIIPLAITGSISMIFILLIIWYFVWRFAIYQDPYATTSSAQELARQLTVLFKL